MAEPTIKLRHLHGNIYEDVNGGMEPVFARSVERGEVQFWHQTGYGYLPASRVEIVPAGVAEVRHQTEAPADADDAGIGHE